MYSIILADETIMKKKYFNFVTLWFCLITFIDVSMPADLNIEIPSDAWNFGPLVERRLINALSTVLYAHQNDLKIVPTKSFGFQLNGIDYRPSRAELETLPGVNIMLRIKNQSVTIIKIAKLIRREKTFLSIYFSITKELGRFFT